jgi:hypothetical protein
MNEQFANWSQNGPKYDSFGFKCPIPAGTNGINRRVFSTVHKCGDYTFLNYLCGNSHSIHATNPAILEIARSKDLWNTCDLIYPKVYNDNGTLRAIDSTTDGFMCWHWMLGSVENKLYLIIPTYVYTVNPPQQLTDFERGPTYISWSDDYGDTWTEMQEIINTARLGTSNPIVVGDEIWWALYGGTGTDYRDTGIFKWNYKTDNIADSEWFLTSSFFTDENYAVAEPALIQLAEDRFMMMLRVTQNYNFQGAENNNRGVLFAFADSDLVFDELDFYNHGTGYPNQPQLFHYNNLIYFVYEMVTGYGEYNENTKIVDWNIVFSATDIFHTKHGNFFRQFYGSDSVSNRLFRYSSRPGDESKLLDLLSNAQDSIGFCVIDEKKDLILATAGFKKDDPDYVGEPWVAIIKKNPISADDVNSYGRYLFIAEIPGDNHTSNEIILYNNHVKSDDTIICKWVDSENHGISITTEILTGRAIKFTAGAPVKNAKIVYEIIKP